MKIREKLLNLLYENGLFEDQALAVLALYEESEMGKVMKDRLDDDIEGYPATVLAGTWMGVCHYALKWIDSNLPQHWARPMFVVERTGPD